MDKATFTLHMHDRAAPAAIREWANKAAELGCDNEGKIAEARRIADEWEAQPIEATKVPD